MYDPRIPRHKKEWHMEPIMGPGMMPSRRFGRFHPLEGPPGLFDDMESKEDAIDFMEYQVKRIEKHKKRLMKAIKRLDSMENIISEKISEIAGMKEFNPDDLKKIIRKTYREFAMRALDEED